MDVVVITWHDAFDDAITWTLLDDLDTGPRTIVTAGWLVRSDDSEMVVALSWDAAAGTVGHVIHIPVSTVQHVDYRAAG